MRILIGLGLLSSSYIRDSNDDDEDEGFYDTRVLCSLYPSHFGRSSLIPIIRHDP